jgi:hypothetical protein
MSIVKDMPSVEVKVDLLKETPTFGFVPRDGHKRLYDAESRASEALKHVAEVRAAEYREDMHKCALPEAIFSLLDIYSPDLVKPAVLHWLRVQMFPERHHRIAGIPRDEVLEREICSLLMERSGVER